MSDDQTVRGSDDTGREERIERTVGSRVRAYRQSAGITATELATRAGISPAMVSRIESATTSCSLKTIARLAAALDVPASALFRGIDAPHGVVVVRSGEATPTARMGTAHGHRYFDLGHMIGLSGPSLEPVLVELNPDGREFPMYEHMGAEFLYMLAGAMEFRYDDTVHVLRAGDSILLDADAPHGPVRLLENPVRFLSVNPLAE